MKYSIGEDVIITSYLSQFRGKIGTVEDSWFSNIYRTGSRHRYGVNLGGCDLVQVFDEEDLETIKN